jgi:hypothetical protein
MIPRALYLAGAWFTISMMVMLLGGSRLRRTHPALSFAWLTIVLGIGDIWAMTTFGKPLEVFILTGLAFVMGLVCIWRLNNWNAFGQVAWLMTLIVTPLFMVYAYSIIISTPTSPLSLSSLP